MAKFRKKNFLWKFFQNYEIQKNRKMPIKKISIVVAACMIAQMKEKKKHYKIMKNFGGVGGRKGVKFHFEVFWDFLNRKIRGISRESWLFTIFFHRGLDYWAMMSTWWRIMKKNFFLGVKLHKNSKKLKFHVYLSSPLGGSR